ncbi:MAG TPA: carboxylating nicotinate-nucleotide diphosphorylase [Kiritimatiellia bacterium]|nr:carboxylating nicotinate-nucleotide diphosphorylase [Kiritimatiellia bacterium]
MSTPLPPLPWDVIDSLIDLALREDLAGGDITTETLFAPDDLAEARILAKAPGVIAGLPVAERVFHRLDPSLTFLARVGDGDSVAPGDLIVELRGTARAILSGERLALNLLQRMSGIATAAARFAEAVQGLPVTLLDTRKTAPGLRLLDKVAVAAGGVTNHRMTLNDLAMIKDNHLARAGGITRAVSLIRNARPGLKIEVETSTLAEVDEALAAGADIIMLDNMSLDDMREAVRRIGGRAPTEASGNVTLERVRAIAETGVTSISIGSLTHSVHALDLSLKIAEA